VSSAIWAAVCRRGTAMILLLLPVGLGEATVWRQKHSTGGSEGHMGKVWHRPRKNGARLGVRARARLPNSVSATVLTGWLAGREEG
jgi:hypothetical protein